MSEQLTIDDLSEGERLRDEGMARVTENSDEADIQRIDGMIHWLNVKGDPWSANNLRAEIERCWPTINKYKPQLMGARVRSAAMAEEDATSRL
jgi:hypothetical protein